jgi:hypothetical protein
MTNINTIDSKICSNKEEEKDKEKETEIEMKALSRPIN